MSIDVARLLSLEPTRYEAHALHAVDRDWPESNCYIDLWIEILHALGLDPRALLSFTVASECEGDQWTFYKPHVGDLVELYGISVEELTVWRKLIVQCADQVAAGRVPLVEVDAFHLPDTAGADYQQAHTKTTIGITAVDHDARTIHYFHNGGFFALGGDDFDGIFTAFERPGALPPFCEIAKLDRAFALPPTQLRERSLAAARRHFARRPPANPLLAYQRRIDAHVEMILDGDTELYHRYAFAFVRQLGSGYAFAADYCRWAGPESDPWLRAATSFDTISQTAKTLLLKLYRVAQRKKAADLRPQVAAMADAWSHAMTAFEQALDG